MTFDPNDPRLTAYVLGELDPSERADIEAMLSECSECRQAVGEIRLTVRWLTERRHEGQATNAQLSGLNHEPIVASMMKPAASPRPWWRSRLTKLGALAALLLLGATVSLISVSQQGRW